MNTDQKNRRQLLQAFSTAPLLPLLPGLSFAATSARSENQNRLILVILRGAMDGLAAVQPFADTSLRALRQSVLVNDNELFKLDSYFGLHPALGNLAGMYQDRDLAVFHAVATPYRERSHFDGQNVLEIGSTTPDQGMSGWINRCVPMLENDTASVLGIGQNTPKILDGQFETSSWAPAVLPEPDVSTITRLQALYAQDAYLGERFMQGLVAKNLAEDMDGMANTNSGRGRRGQNFNALAQAAGKFLAQDTGPVIAVLESTGWDTHANQGAGQGQLANKLTELDNGMATLKTALGKRWDQSMVLVVTEFGRTAAENGTGGTDHGTASAAFLLGGAVKGGQMKTDWPGLAPGSLHEGRDLRPTRDIRELFAFTLNTHLGISSNDVANHILPGFPGNTMTL